MSEKIIATVLGCGSSGGVPRLGGPDGAGDWGACDPDEPKNRRTRCSLLVRRGQGDHSTAILIDTSPDMRVQLLGAQCRRLDAVFYTHDHADQTHGVDDLRVFALQQRARVPVFIDENTSGRIVERFSYCFVQKEGSWYPPVLEKRVMPACGETIEIVGEGGPIPVTPFLQHHGPVDSLGFRIGDIAYSSDVVDLPEDSFEILDGVRTWIVDALQMKPHGTHAHLEKTLEWIARVKPERGVLTNLHVTMDYATLRRSLPAGVEPAFDGMTIEGAV
ncbi:MAG: MBL fold metallo-hydrolase [Alphaproteobacteria bacterium]|nr:MBL fold metallo-hydrolase [Alphaproteobacteria bacterium]